MLFSTISLGVALISIAFSSDLANTSKAAREMSEAAAAVIEETPSGPPPGLELRLPPEIAQHERKRAAALMLAKALETARDVAAQAASDAIQLRVDGPGRGNGNAGGNGKGNGKDSDGNNAGGNGRGLALGLGNGNGNGNGNAFGQQQAASAARAKANGYGAGGNPNKGPPVDPPGKNK